MFDGQFLVTMQIGISKRHKSEIRGVKGRYGYKQVSEKEMKR